MEIQFKVRVLTWDDHQKKHQITKKNLKNFRISLEIEAQVS